MAVGVVDAVSGGWRRYCEALTVQVCSDVAIMRIAYSCHNPSSLGLYRPQPAGTAL